MNAKLLTLFSQRHRNVTLPLTARTLLETPRSKIRVQKISNMDVYYYDLREEMT